MVHVLLQVLLQGDGVGIASDQRVLQKDAALHVGPEGYLVEKEGEITHRLGVALGEQVYQVYLVVDREALAGLLVHQPP